MLDLKEAFHAVNHDIVLQNFYFYGIWGVAHDLLNSFLYNRKQFVMINSMALSFNPNTCGVPYACG